MLLLSGQLYLIIMVMGLNKYKVDMMLKRDPENKTRRYWVCRSTPTNKKGKFVIHEGEFLERTMKHRGWLNGRILYTRPMNDDENYLVNCYTRYVAYRYADWQGLCEDECRCGANASWLARAYQKRVFGYEGGTP